MEGLQDYKHMSQVSRDKHFFGGCDSTRDVLSSSV